MQNIEKARTRLVGEVTLVLTDGTEMIESRCRGVRPLLDLFDTGRSFCGFSAADRVVGRGAAFLYVVLGVSEVYAKVLSEAAAELLSRHGVKYTAEALVPRIKNRTGDGFCPIESAVVEITDPHEALEAIRKRLASL